MTTEQTPLRYATPRGLLRLRVTLRRFTNTGTDPRGAPVGTWDDVATLYAAVQPLSGRWAEYARQLYEEATYRVLVDYRSDVTSADRLVYAGRTLAIGHVINQDEQGHTLELLCTEARA